MAKHWHAKPKYDKKNNNWLPAFLESLKKCGYHKVRLTATAPDDQYSGNEYHGFIECYFPVAWENTKREPSVEQPRPVHFSRPAVWELLDDSPFLKMGCGNGQNGVHQAQWTSVNCPIEYMPPGYAIGAEYTLVPEKKKPAKLGEPIFIHSHVMQCVKCKFRWHELSTTQRRGRVSDETYIYGYKIDEVDKDALPVDECEDCKKGIH